MEDLYALHAALAASFSALLSQPDQSKVRASHLNVLRLFLRDNKVGKDLGQSRAIKASLEDLVDADIPFLPVFND